MINSNESNVILEFSIIFCKESKVDWISAAPYGTKVLALFKHNWDRLLSKCRNDKFQAIPKKYFSSQTTEHQLFKCLLPWISWKSFLNGRPCIFIQIDPFGLLFHPQMRNISIQYGKEKSIQLHALTTVIKTKSKQIIKLIYHKWNKSPQIVISFGQGLNRNDITNSNNNGISISNK